MQNKLFATMITALLVMLMAGSAMCATYDSNMTLENKNSTWDVIDDDYSVLIEYNSVGEEFSWHAEGKAMSNETSYSLIYYADKPDRFNYWGGDNPGAFIDTIMTDTNGDFESMGSVELGMDLPMTPDSNMNASEYNYTESDGYENANGAKLWLVLSDDYDVADKKVNKWNPTQWLFETNLITYEDCTEFYTQDVPANATFSIGDVFNTETMSIMVLNATNAGSVDMTLTYNASIVTITGVTNGDMDSMFKNEGVGTVRIGAYQTNNPGLDGDFVLVNVTFEIVGDGSCDSDIFGITVTTYKDATPCGRSMPYIVDTGIYCACLNGDVNCDSDVDMFDVMYIAKYSLVKAGFENICECAADVDGSGNVDIADASYLAKYILGFDDYDPLR